MKIPVTLNGEKIILDANPDEKLLTVLRKMGNGYSFTTNGWPSNTGVKKDDADSVLYY